MYFKRAAYIELSVRISVIKIRIISMVKTNKRTVNMGFITFVLALTVNSTGCSTSSPAPQSETEIQLQSLLKQQYKVVNTGGDYSQLVSQTSNTGIVAPADSNYKVIKVENFDDSGFFQHQKILLIKVNKMFLEAWLFLADFESQGIFAYDGKTLTYLNGIERLKNVSSIFARENRSLEQASPSMLANFFTQTILHGDPMSRISIIRSPNDILDRDYAAMRARLGNPSCILCDHYYTVNKVELQKFAPEIKVPMLSGNKKDGWKFTFIGLRESRNPTVPSSLVKFAVSISPKFAIQVTENVFGISNKIIR